uniref:Uncharacterized protein n=1 Tax=Caenorhabditis japonica TaxID=281687 RepID=A0A8R1EJL4_CAEJA
MRRFRLNTRDISAEAKRRRIGIERAQEFEEELESERDRSSRHQKPNAEKEAIMTSFDPIAILNWEEVVVVNSVTNDGQFNTNSILAQIPPQKGTLRSIVQMCANRWMNAVLPMSLRAVYTTSPKPRKYKTLPSSIINAPVLLLAKCLSVPSLDQEVAALTIGLLFFKHVTYLW